MIQKQTFQQDILLDYHLTLLKLKLKNAAHKQKSLTAYETISSSSMKIPNAEVFQIRQKVKTLKYRHWCQTYELRETQISAEDASQYVTGSIDNLKEIIKDIFQFLGS